MQVDLDRFRRWLPAIVHTPFHRKALFAVTGVTAMAALAAGTAGSGGDPASAAGAYPASRTAATQTADPASGVALRTADTGSSSSSKDDRDARKNDRDIKIEAAKAKAEEAKAAKAAKIKGGGKAKAADGTAPNGKAADAGSGAKTTKDQAGGRAPSMDELLPNGAPDGQQSFTPTAEQMRNAEAIVDTGKKMNLPERAYVIAVATSLQESKLQNLGHLGALNDHDSLGLFQQRPSSGWGTPEQITDPDYAAEQFYKALEQVPGYETMPLSQAAQTVQVSAFPEAYAQWEQMAADIVQATHGAGPYADIAASADK